MPVDVDCRIGRPLCPDGGECADLAASRLRELSFAVAFSGQNLGTNFRWTRTPGDYGAFQVTAPNNRMSPVRERGRVLKQFINTSGINDNDLVLVIACWVNERDKTDDRKTVTIDIPTESLTNGSQASNMETFVGAK